MKYILTAAAAAFALAGCGSGSEDSLQASCMVVMMDDDAQEHFAEAGVTAEEICSCTLTHAATFSEDERHDFGSTFGLIAKNMTESGASAEDTVGLIIRKAMLTPGDTETQSMLASLSVIRETTDDIIGGLEETGACPAPST